MKIKILVCVATALLICSAASADYLQIAQEAAVNGAAGADEMLEYVYNSGAARDPKEEIRRLYIWDYLLELKKQEADLISDVYYTAYTELNRSGELDYLAELADRYSRRAGELTEELNRNYAYLSLVEKSGPEVNAAAENAAELIGENSVERKSRADNGLLIAFIIAALILTAIITSVIMAYLGKVKKRGLKGRRLRDLRRCLLARRGVILAVGIFFAAASAVAALPLSEKQTPSLPSSGGEYLYAAESLLDYCDGLDLKPGSAAAEKVENVMRYQLSSAMAEILNNKAAINLKEVRTHYQRLAEHKDSANHTGLARAQEMRKAAEDGSALSYLDRVKDYMEQEIEAGLAGIKADYYHNLVDLMRADVAVTEGAGERARAYIDGAAEALTEILTVPPRPELPMLAALAGYAAGILISMAIVLLVSLIRLGVRRNSQNGRTESMENADIMDMISFRG